MQEPTASPTAEAPLPVATEEKVIADPEEKSEEKVTTETEETQEPETEEGTQEEPEAPVLTSFNSEDFKDDTEFQSFLEGKESKAHRNGQIRETGRRKETQLLVTQVNAGIESLTRVIANAVKEGSLTDEAFRSVMQENAPTLAAYGEVLKKEQLLPMRQHNQALAKAGVVADVATLIGEPDLAEEYIQRLVKHVGNDPQSGAAYFHASDEYVIEEEDEKSGSGGSDALTDFFKAALKVVDKKGFERGVRSRDGTVTERAKAEGREGKGPSEVKDAGGSNKPYSQLNLGQRKKLAEEGKVDQYIAQYGG